MGDIFISYASEDRPRAQTLAEALAGQGWSTFWDRTIPTGKTWREVIGAALEEARCVVVLWSDESADSRWVPPSLQPKNLPNPNPASRPIRSLWPRAANCLRRSAALRVINCATEEN